MNYDPEGPNYLHVLSVWMIISTTNLELNQITASRSVALTLQYLIFHTKIKITLKKPNTTLSFELKSIENRRGKDYVAFSGCPLKYSNCQQEKKKVFYVVKQKIKVNTIKMLTK